MTTTLTNGTVAQIFGPVVDVRFPAGALPPIYTALRVQGTGGSAGRGEDLTLEVAQHLGNDVARCVAMATTDGCRRGMPVINSGAPVSSRDTCWRSARSAAWCATPIRRAA